MKQRKKSKRHTAGNTRADNTQTQGKTVPLNTGVSLVPQASLTEQTPAQPGTVLRLVAHMRKRCVNRVRRMSREAWNDVKTAAFEYLTLAALAILLYREMPGIVVGLLVQVALSANLRTKNLRRRNQHLNRVIVALTKSNMTDRQTGLLNKAALEDEYVGLYDRCTRMGRSCAMMEIDIDGFKIHNDLRGHQYGDIVIALVVDVLKVSAREAADLIGRDGGDEFRLVMDGTSKEVAVQIAHRICASVAELVSELPITVSIGVAAMNEATSADELIGLADRRLYRAKAAGGNQVVFN